ncbi:hypothetical protein BDV25DRAFT_137839 [Aspergillus avenaceus]|uniref:Uncharacterized protein n=1 Tax=Aspergillus avenaceus TaxID=36643 RepID=A0A5N6U1X2_ASPAV|nr:hypothetical protein BDV25DRAFT_137839 [Aspergillus avenaceus]
MNKDPSILIYLYPIILLTLSALFTITLYKQTFYNITTRLTQHPNDTNIYPSDEEYQPSESDLSSDTYAVSTHSDSSTSDEERDWSFVKYFDSGTGLIHKHVFEPADPPMPAWERELIWRVQHGTGFRAFWDRVVDGLVRSMEGLDV